MNTKLGRGVSIATLVAAASALLSLLPAHAEAGAARTPVWIGSPLTGTWPTASGCSGARYPSASCSLPSAHHTYRWSNPYPGDFGFDLQSVGSGAGVHLYAAPRDSRLGGAITARVQSVLLACARRSGESHAATRARGGDAVTIAIYHGSTKIGTATYVHVDAHVRAGQSINRWGTRVGTVGSYRGNSCWQGRHVHMELYSETNYACYNRGWRPGQRMNPTNFVGFIGGAFATAPRRPCP